MPLNEQFLYANFHHFSLGDSTCSSLTKDVESSQCSNDECFGAHAKADGKHQELWRISGDSPSGQPAVHSLFW